MSIQLVDNTLSGVYGRHGVKIVKELQALVEPQSWQLDYIPETSKFSILGCGPTVKKQDIEAIFARRTQYPLFKTEILDSFYYGNRQFTLTLPAPIMLLRPTRAALDIPLEERARRFLAPSLEAARQLTPEQPPIQLRLSNRMSNALKAAIAQVLAESGARVEIIWERNAPATSGRNTLGINYYPTYHNNFATRLPNFQQPEPRGPIPARIPLGSHLNQRPLNPSILGVFSDPIEPALPPQLHAARQEFERFMGSPLYEPALCILEGVR